MKERALARAIVAQMDDRARRTRANERGQIQEIDADGNYVVTYRGATVTLPNTGRQLSAGDWANVTRSAAGLQVSGPSAYGVGQ